MNFVFFIHKIKYFNVKAVLKFVQRHISLEYRYFIVLYFVSNKCLKNKSSQRTFFRDIQWTVNTV